MKQTPIQSGNSTLRPRARLIKTIGEELISNDIVAIIELVKNSYDADASIISIEFRGRVKTVTEGKISKRVLIGQGSALVISDDGCGMDLDTIAKAWMEPATVMKKNDKVSPNKSRRYTGEKGIGRFASAKLASKLKMISKKENDNEIVVDFDWADFSDETKYLDQINCNWEVREPLVIQKSGTALQLSELNIDWDEEKLRELRIALSRLVNPVSPVADFLIEILLPEDLKDLSGLVDGPASLHKPDYTIKGHIDAEGKPEITYRSKKKGTSETLQIESLKLRHPVREPSVGPFSFEFRVWDRDPKTMRQVATEIGSTLKDIKSDLDDLAGISIYRDHFRVQPYGEKKNDWLRLDIRRVNNPTMRLSNNQVVGYVSVSLDKNPDLKDQSNREGIIESQAFVDFKEFIVLVLNELEQRRYEERPRESDKSKSGLFDRFSIAPVARLISNKLPNDIEAKEIVERTEAHIKEGVIKVQEVISRYRRLSTLGLLIDVILHEGNNFLARIDTDLYLLSKEVEKKEIDVDTVQGHVRNFSEEKRVLAQLFKRLEPLGGRKQGRAKDVILEEAITNAFNLFRSDLDKLDIQFSLPDSTSVVRIDNSDLQLILVNLIQNALYWLETIQTERRIQVDVVRVEDELSLVFSDNGPGVKEEQSSLIFDPYFTTRPDGIGLGLTTVGELVTEHNGEISLVNNGPLDGATFKITFRSSI